MYFSFIYAVNFHIERGKKGKGGGGIKEEVPEDAVLVVS